MSTNFVERLADVLIKIKALKPEERDAIAVNFKNRQKDNFGYFLLDEGLVSRQQLLRAYSLLYNLPALDVQGFMFDHDLVTSFDKDVLLEQEAIPVESDESIIIFCVSDPEKPGLEEELGKYTDSIVELQVGIGRDILDAIEDYFEDVPDEMLYDQMEEEIKVEEEDDVDYI
jgi:hypothetical protein